MPDQAALNPEKAFEVGHRSPYRVTDGLLAGVNRPGRRFRRPDGTHISSNASQGLKSLATLNRPASGLPLRGKDNPRSHVDKITQSLTPASGPHDAMPNAAPAPVTSYQLPVTSYQLPVTSYELRVTSYELRVTSYPLPVTR